MTPVRVADDAQNMRAGLVSRSVADVFDAFTVALILVVGYFSFCAVLFIISPRNFSFPTPERQWTILIGGLVVIAYLTFGWFTTGRTPGKQLAGLRVVDQHGLPLGLARALARAILYVVFPVGFLWSAFSSKSASVQDLLLHTSVIYDWRSHAMEPIPLGLRDSTPAPR